MTNYECWVKGCEINHTNVYLLERQGKCSLFKTNNEYTQNNQTFYTNPVFHVWNGDMWETATEDYQAAYHIYKERLEEM